MSVPSPVSYQLLRLIKWRIGGVMMVFWWYD